MLGVPSFFLCFFRLFRKSGHLFANHQQGESMLKRLNPTLVSEIRIKRWQSHIENWTWSWTMTDGAMGEKTWTNPWWRVTSISPSQNQTHLRGWVPACYAWWKRSQRKRTPWQTPATKQPSSSHVEMLAATWSFKAGLNLFYSNVEM